MRSPSSPSRPGSYLVRRLLQGVPLILGVLVITFCLIHLAPGDPIYVLAGDGGNAAYYREMRARFGLDRSLIEQLVRYILGILSGDAGYSFTYQQPVYQVVLARVPATLLLMGTALVLSIIMGLVLGILTATRPRSWLDSLVNIFTSTTYPMPAFWLGQLLILLFAVQLNLFPVQGMVSVREQYTGFEQLLDIARHRFLPSLTLSLSYLALIVKLTRTSLREVLAEDFIRTARAKGLPERSVLWVHGLRNALLPVVTVIGGHIGTLLTGAALTETIFAWPGLGRLLLDATLKRDYPLLMAIFILVAFTVVLTNILTDLIYSRLDPRVRFS